MEIVKEKDDAYDATNSIGVLRQKNHLAVGEISNSKEIGEISSSKGVGLLEPKQQGKNEIEEGPKLEVKSTKEVANVNDPVGGQSTDEITKKINMLSRAHEGLLADNIDKIKPKTTKEIENGLIFINETGSNSNAVLASAKNEEKDAGNLSPKNHNVKPKDNKPPVNKKSKSKRD
jgi:hypothetical protein